MMPPIATVQRGPHTSPTQPIRGAPSGVPPRKIAWYSAITRPRMIGVVDSCTDALAAVITVSEASPVGTSSTA